MSLVENERTKLLAGAFDRASTACVTVGLLAPAAALIYGAGVTSIRPTTLAISAVIWIATAIVLHFFANRILGGLK